MKKYELIKFLEPYMDDIEIDIHPAYQNDGIGRIINTLDINTKPPSDRTAKHCFDMNYDKLAFEAIRLIKKVLCGNNNISTELEMELNAFLSRADL